MSNLVADPAEVKNAMAHIKGLQVPSPPALLLSISNELAQSEPDKKKIIAQINEDIALSGKILQIINSPAYGLRNKVKSVDHATNLLGLPRLKTQVIAGALRYALERALPGFEAISEYSHCVGVAAQLIAKNTEDLSEEDAYIAGLFHEAGTMMLLQLFTDYNDVYSQNRSQPFSFIELEKANYSVTHPVIGFMLGYRWKLTNDVCNAIYCSHYHLADVDESIQLLLASVHIGIHLANENILGLTCEEDEECYAILSDAMEKLNIDEDALDKLTEDFNEAIA